MKVHVVRTSQFNTKELLEWCKNQFIDFVKVHGPTHAELHRVSYDNSVYGIIVFYFTDSKDFLMFTLRWS